MTFEQYLLSLGYYRDEESGNWFHAGDDGRVHADIDGLYDQWNNLYNFQFRAGDQVGVGGGTFYWYPAGQGWESNPGIPSGALHYYAGGYDPYGHYLPEGWLVDKAPMDAAHPGDNEFRDFATVAAIAFGAGYALSTFVLPSIATAPVADIAPAVSDVIATQAPLVEALPEVATPFLDESAGLLTDAISSSVPEIADAVPFLDESAGLATDAIPSSLPSLPSIPSLPSLPKIASGLTSAVSSVIKALTSSGTTPRPGSVLMPGSVPGQYLSPGVVNPYGYGQNSSGMLVVGGLALLAVLALKRKKS